MTARATTSREVSGNADTIHHIAVGRHLRSRLQLRCQREGTRPPYLGRDRCSAWRGRFDHHWSVAGRSALLSSTAQPQKCKGLPGPCIFFLAFFVKRSLQPGTIPLYLHHRNNKHQQELKMNQVEFFAAYPFASRQECIAAL